MIFLGGGLTMIFLVGDNNDFSGDITNDLRER